MVTKRADRKKTKRISFIPATTVLKSNIILVISENKKKDLRYLQYYPLLLLQEGSFCLIIY